MAPGSEVEAPGSSKETGSPIVGEAAEPTAAPSPGDKAVARAESEEEAGNQGAEPTTVAGSPAGEQKPSTEPSSSKPATAAWAPPESAPEDASAVADQPAAVAGKDDATATPSTPTAATSAVANEGNQPPGPSMEEADPTLNEVAKPTATAASPATEEEPSPSTPTTTEPTTASLPPTEPEETTPVAAGQPAAAVVEQSQPAEAEDDSAATVAPPLPSHSSEQIVTLSAPTPATLETEVAVNPSEVAATQPRAPTDSVAPPPHGGKQDSAPSGPASGPASSPSDEITPGPAAAKDGPQSRGGDQVSTPTTSVSNVKVKGGARTPTTPAVPMLVPAPATTSPVVVPATPTASDTSAADAMSTGRDCLVSGDLEKFSMGRRTKGMALGINFGSLFGMKNWKTRHFRLFSDGALSYFETAESATPLDVVMVRNGGTIVEKAGPSDHPNATGANDFCVVFNDGTEQVTLLLRAASTEDRLQWVTALRGITAPAL